MGKNMRKNLILASVLFLFAIACMACSNKVKAKCDICGEKEDCNEIDNLYVCDYCMKDYEEHREEFQEFINKFPNFSYSDYIYAKTVSSVNKEIESSRKRTDGYNYDFLVALCSISMTNQKVFEQVIKNDYEVVMDSSGITINKNGSAADVEDAFCVEFNGLLDEYDAASVCAKAGGPYKITITRDGEVVRTKEP